MSWDEYADTWDADEAARAYAVAVCSNLEELASAHGLQLQGATVFDFGCGTGLLTDVSALSFQRSGPHKGSVENRLLMD